MEFYLTEMSQVREYIEKHPSETQRLVGVDYEQLIESIGLAERIGITQKIKLEIH
ncbi:hypothetical protein H6S82_06875 [Planktothrix sp. FACHB-1355]|uniref:Uncharacterized protein n=1 Tax=Aerosakkonema funiforme FACHB-1375 TaxID=2949571 RepID=A0A926ZMG1_9CYAN|nr:MULTISPECIES: hypothetical protein [Oscillatoriales]MBD2186036.1 hypothetical protein [Aerosakkonema funiforme FACHB-1375]MBD3558579.1 hypothetical protein [Planktothrix sp. FACHB-1355]